MTVDPLIWRTRLHFATISHEIIDDAVSGKTPVDDLPGLIAWQSEAIRLGMAGESDHTFTFQQMLHYFRTGECVPFLTN